MPGQCNCAEIVCLWKLFARMPPTLEFPKLLIYLKQVMLLTKFQIVFSEEDEINLKVYDVTFCLTSTGFPIQRFRVQNHWVVPSWTQPFIFLRLIE